MYSPSERQTLQLEYPAEIALHTDIDVILLLFFIVLQFCIWYFFPVSVIKTGIPRLFAKILKPMQIRNINIKVFFIVVIINQKIYSNHLFRFSSSDDSFPQFK